MIPPSQRLKELIEFAQQTALLRASPVADISRHGVFLEYEHSIVSLPGLSFDVTQGDGDIETWFVVERLQESPVPKPGSVLLNTWIELANNPAKEPTLRSHVEFQKLLDIGALLFPKDKENFDPNQLVALDSFEHKKSVEDQFKTYVANVWKPWAMEERRRRQTISLYAKVEHPFLVLKRLFGFRKVRYRGIMKNANRLFVACALTNLYMVRRRLLGAT